MTISWAMFLFGMFLFTNSLIRAIKHYKNESSADDAAIKNAMMANFEFVSAILFIVVAPFFPF